jgi:threonine dehydrogenase-like Zn-dependent dehydrogenase
MHGVNLLTLHLYQKALVIGNGFIVELFVQTLKAMGVQQVDLSGISDEKLKLTMIILVLKQLILLKVKKLLTMHTASSLKLLVTR